MVQIQVSELMYFDKVKATINLYMFLYKLHRENIDRLRHTRNHCVWAAGLSGTLYFDIKEPPPKPRFRFYDSDNKIPCETSFKFYLNLTSGEYRFIDSNPTMQYSYTTPLALAGKQSCIGIRYSNGTHWSEKLLECFSPLAPEVDITLAPSVRLMDSLHQLLFSYVSEDEYSSILNEQAQLQGVELS